LLAYVGLASQTILLAKVRQFTFVRSLLDNTVVTCYVTDIMNINELG